MDTNSLEYKRAFEAYVRYGTSQHLSLKKQDLEPPTTHYIWRTRGDGKVRPSHSANDGKIFAWDDSPDTGHPGDAYGCRCTAEPYYPTIEENITITFTSISDASKQWKHADFVSHYFNGNGRAVRVRETGHLTAITNEYRKIVIEDPARLPSQLANRARETKNGSFSDYFENVYNMTSMVFSIGHTTIGGTYSGNSSEKNSILSFSGNIDFYLEDEFKDPVDIFDWFPSYDIEVPGAKPYRIFDKWRGQVIGKVYMDETRSSY